MHGSGLMRVATPSSQKTFTSYSLAGLPAHSRVLKNPRRRIGPDEAFGARDGFEMSAGVFQHPVKARPFQRCSTRKLVAPRAARVLHSFVDPDPRR